MEPKDQTPQQLLGRSFVRHQTPKLGGHVLIGGMRFVNHMVLVECEIKAQLLMTIPIKKVLSFMYVLS
jgi:hypothetical protein